ncbi:Transcriptional regulatory protein moc3-like protein 2 [Colletotrichum chlorophyti]|uniref:Transcriptional regulatory protein moc3-like protein 2 n=1 Tax=Colletotrichum chlorophyti TaxID=708187 RepID=A0A1Q8S6P6_9PEZI|nr:Transcriptional regulatory protein moc3-like protein 2 [Colletotrichum chlorophyti]
MVYTGKPSGGCKLCRIRKVKCDEAKPFCMRCTKSKRHCPGYGPVIRDRDQSKQAAEKIKKLRAGSSESTGGVESSIPFRPGSTGDCCEKTTSLSPPRRSSTPIRFGDKENDIQKCFVNVPGGLLSPLDEQASCLFLSEFVNVPLTPTARGYYSFLPRFIGSGEMSLCLSTAFKATSMAALAMRQTKGMKGPALLRAQEHHIKALRAVGQAIADPEEMRSDQTLGAVLMLAFYEALMTKDSMKEYVSHVKGAARIVQMRGMQCLETDEGREMFALTRNQCLSVQHLYRDAEMAGYSWLLYNEAVQRTNRATVDINLHASQLQQAVDRIVTRAVDPTPEMIEMMLGLLDKARKLEDEFRKLRENPNPQWKVEVAEWVFDRSDEELDTEPTFEGQVFKFFNLPMAVLHLVTWVTHLNLITTMIRCSSWLASAGREGLDDLDEYSKLVRSATGRVEDIISAVPYFCSWNGYGVVVSQFPCGITKPEDPLKGEAGLIVMWPIAMAMKSDYATPRQRRYLRARLRYIADVSGIEQARFFINEV